jgi:2-haloacid dehalogenase
MSQSNPLYQAIIFDFGGVLIDWNPRYLYRKFFAGDSESMERFLTEIGFAEWNLQQDKGRSFAVAVAELCVRFPDYADLIRAYDQHWEESIAGPIQPTVNILRSLKQVGYRLYGLSNWSVEKFEIVRPRYEFFGWLDTILVSGEVKLVKPDPRIYTVLLERIGRTAKECLFIDDSRANVAAADQLGFKTVHYESPEQLETELCHLGILRRKRR